MRPARGRLPRVAWAAGLLAGVLSLAAPRATAGDAAAGDADFARIAAAWAARNAAEVARAVAAKGRVTISLEGAGRGRVSGRVTRVQAEAILEGYFEDVDRVSLRDVTPPEDRGSTRTYDYSYRPRGGEACTTRLSFTLAPARDGGFALVSVEERPRGT